MGWSFSAWRPSHWWGWARSWPPFAPGYVRTGNEPSDKALEDPKNKDFNGRLIGATIYFRVYDRDPAKLSDKGDAFGTGMAGFDDRFRVGKDSPDKKFDTAARSLYLYQIVNDRGMDPDQPAALKRKSNPLALSRSSCP